MLFLIHTRGSFLVVGSVDFTGVGVVGSVDLVGVMGSVRSAGVVDWVATVGSAVVMGLVGSVGVVVGLGFLLRRLIDSFTDFLTSAMI